MRIEIDVQRNVGDARLGQAFERQQRLLVIRCPFHAVVEGAVRIEDVRVVIDVAAKRDHRDQRWGGDQRGRAHQPARQAFDPHHQRRRGAATP